VRGREQNLPLSAFTARRVAARVAGLAVVIEEVASRPDDLRLVVAFSELLELAGRDLLELVGSDTLQAAGDARLKQ